MRRHLVGFITKSTAIFTTTSDKLIETVEVSFAAAASGKGVGGGEGRGG